MKSEKRTLTAIVCVLGLIFAKAAIFDVFLAELL